MIQISVQKLKEPFPTFFQILLLVMHHNFSNQKYSAETAKKKKKNFGGPKSLTKALAFNWCFSNDAI